MTAGLAVVEAVRDKVREWLAGNIELDSADIAVLGGSLAAGLGNATSDIDVYLVRRTLPPALEGRQFFVAGRRVDVHDVALAQLADDVVAMELNPGSANQDTLTLVYRTLNGIPLTPATLDSTLIGRGNQALRRALPARAAGRIRPLWRRLGIATDMRNLDRARILATEIVEEALCAALAHHGELYPHRKWNWEKLLRLPDPAAVLGPLDRLADSLLGGWPAAPQPAAVHAALGSLGLKVVLPEDNRWYPVRVPGLNAHRVGPACYVTRGMEAYELSASAYALLRLCTGDRTVEQIAAELHARFGMSMTRVDNDACKTLDILCSLGLIGDGAETRGRPSELPELAGEQILFEPEIWSRGAVPELLRHLHAVWASWLEYLSFRDDLRGALDGGQTGAALAAARGVGTALARIWLEANNMPRRSEDVMDGLRAAAGAESRPYRDLVELWQVSIQSRPSCEWIESRVAALTDHFLGNPRVILAGGLLDEDGHSKLFSFVRQLLDMAEATGVDLEVDQMIRDKSRIYGSADEYPGR